MSNNLSKSIKELTISYLSDGQMRSTKEIKTFLTKNNVNFEKSHSIFSTAMTNLKKENPLLKNPKRGFYYLEISKKDDIETHTTSADNIFEDFEDVLPISKKEIFLVASVLPDNTLAISSHLLSFFPKKEAGIKIKKDASQLLLIPDGKPEIYLGKNGRTKNYYISQKLQQCHKKIPSYYVGEWDKKNNFWLGYLSTTNPNSSKKISKSKLGPIGGI